MTIDMNNFNENTTKKCGVFARSERTQSSSTWATMNHGLTRTKRQRKVRRCWKGEGAYSPDQVQLHHRKTVFVPTSPHRLVNGPTKPYSIHSKVARAGAKSLPAGMSLLCDASEELCRPVQIVMERMGLRYAGDL